MAKDIVVLNPPVLDLPTTNLKDDKQKTDVLLQYTLEHKIGLLRELGRIEEANKLQEMIKPIHQQKMATSVKQHDTIEPVHQQRIATPVKQQDMIEPAHQQEIATPVKQQDMSEPVHQQKIATPVKQ